MLRKLHLKNFQQHEDLTLYFEDGLVVLRGRNEAGKSTIIRGALYALFGAKALSLPLAKTVTWGKPESSLAVELIIEVEGEQYLFKRSAKGAECHYTGGSVTGQSEVSKFAAEILGEDYARVSKLMIANQNNLRGALEEGPAKVAEYIEDLSGMDLFDNLLTLASEHLLSGNAGVFETAVADAQLTVNNVQAAIVEPDWASFDMQIHDCEHQRDDALDVVSATKPLHAEKQAELQKLRAVEASRAQTESQIAVVREQIDKVVKEGLALAETAANVVDPHAIESLENQIADAGAVGKVAVIYEMFTKLVYPQDVYWTGTQESFETYVKQQQGNRMQLVEESMQVAAEIKSLTSTANQSLDIDTVCPTCGQAFADADAKAAHLAELKQEVAVAKESLARAVERQQAITKSIKAIEDEAKALEAVKQSATPFLNFALINKEYLEVDTNFFPPKLAWVVDVPDTSVSVDELKAQLTALRKQDADAHSAQIRIDGLRERASQLGDQLRNLEQGLVTVDVEALQKLADEVFQLEEAIHLANWKATDMSNRIVATNTSRDFEKQKFVSALEGLETAKKQLETAEKQLATVRFNNSLIKKIRAARPLVADKLWSTVLLSVNSMFTQMRGTPSVVTKDKDGFAVNGEPIAGLSGSTLDILGLALRSSLVKSFLPHTSMMVLDEPAAAMDDDRAVNMLGFIAASGFKQTLLITHEDISEQFADQLISL